LSFVIVVDCKPLLSASSEAEAAKSEIGWHFVLRRGCFEKRHRLHVHVRRNAKRPASSSGPLRNLLELENENYFLMSGGSLPPFAASLSITCLCSQIFIVAESLVSPV
jgi:hypothetical protein